MGKCSVLSCSSWCYVAPMRHVTATILLFGVIIAYTHRSVLSVSIVEMVVTKDKTVKGNQCPLPKDQKSSVIQNIQGGKRNWGEDAQANILSAFYIGYLPIHIPAGYLCDKYGARRPLLLAYLISSVLTVLTPLCVRYFNYYLFLLNRIIIGCAQAVVFPGVTSLMSKWIPPEERATIGGVVYAANNLGMICGNLFTGLAITSTQSWTVPYYIWGGLGCIYFVIFAMYIYSSPETHPHILEEEFEFISSVIKVKPKYKSPILKMFKDPQMYGLIFGQIGHSYLIFTMANNFPKYLNNVLRYDMKGNAFASSLPFLAPYISSVLSGKLADWAIKKKNANIEVVRKTFHIVADPIASLFLLAAGFMDCNRTLAMTCFSIAMCLTGPFYSGLKVMPMDISKNHAGTVMSIMNGLASCAAIAAPKVIANVAPDNTLDQWHCVYGILSGFSWLMYILFAILTTTKRSKWDYTEEELANMPPPSDAPKPKWYHEK